MVYLIDKLKKNFLHFTINFCSLNYPQIKQKYNKL